MAIPLTIIGCGALAEMFYLPVLAATNQFRVTSLVDRNLARAKQLAERFEIPSAARDYQEIAGQAEAAILAVPNYLHKQLTVDLLRQGVHVLVEKPMALNRRECDEMIETADETGLVLAVGLVRRFYAAATFVKQFIDGGWLGPIHAFDVREGGIFSWPAVSDFFFRRETAGGGVLIDTGPHVLDLLLWWLGDYEEVTYYDDALGGVEADCELHLGLRNGARGIVEISRTRNLRNTFLLCGERGTLEVGIGPGSPIRLTMAGRSAVVLEGEAKFAPSRRDTYAESFHRQVEDFAEAIVKHWQPLVPGREGRKGIELIEACYTRRQPLSQPWLCPQANGANGQRMVP